MEAQFDLTKEAHIARLMNSINDKMAAVNALRDRRGKGKIVFEEAMVEEAGVERPMALIHIDGRENGIAFDMSDIQSGKWEVGQVAQEIDNYIASELGIEATV